MTIAALTLGCSLASTMIWLERRPRTRVGPRFPTTPLLLLGVFIALIALVHLLTLSGVEMPRRGRLRP